MVKCLSCGGVYDPVSQGGGRYYHACPPIIRVAVERDGAAQLVDLADVKSTDVIAVQRAGAAVKVAVADVKADDMRLGDTFVERADKRDENVRIVGVDQHGSAKVEPKSPGKGVEAVA